MLKESATNQDLSERFLMHDKMHFSTRFNFLLETKGIRPGTFTVLLGTTGCGKSSLLKSLIAESTEFQKTLVALSEENLIDYQMGITIAYPNFPRENLIFFEERGLGDFDFTDAAQCIEYFLEYVRQSGARIVFFDNITTSFIYDDRWGVRGQAKAVEKIHDFCNDTGITIFALAHTKKDVGDNIRRLIDGEDVRGSNQLFQKTEYFYIMQRFQIGTDWFPFIRIRKHRFHQIDNQFFFLIFDKQKGIYAKDKTVTFEEINKSFLNRNQLGREKNSNNARVNRYQKYRDDF